MILKIYRVLIFIFFLFLLIPSGHAVTQYSPYYIFDDLSEANIVGTYVIDLHNVSTYQSDFDLKLDSLSKLPSITIERGGGYSVENFPQWIETRPYHYKFDKFSSSEGGIWKKVIVGRMESKNGEVRNHWGLKLGGLESAENRPGLIEKEGVYGLLFVFGDPDSNEVIVFRKIN